MGLMSHAEVKEIADKKILDMAVDPVTQQEIHLAGSVGGRGSRFEIPYELIYKERVKKADLKSAYDVIIVPNQGTSGKRLVFDIENRGQPIEYKTSEKFRNLGMYGESNDITGGMGLEGVAEFEKF